MLTLWIIDDNAALLTSLKLALAADYDLLTFTDPALCLVAFQDHLQRKPDIVLADYEMPNLNGLELLEVILKRRPATRGYLFSSALTEAVVVQARKIGAKGWLGKPFDLKKLFQVFASTW